MITGKIVELFADLSHTQCDIENGKGMSENGDRRVPVLPPRSVAVLSS